MPFHSYTIQFSVSSKHYLITVINTVIRIYTSYTFRSNSSSHTLSAHRKSLGLLLQALLAIVINILALKLKLIKTVFEILLSLQLHRSFLSYWRSVLTNYDSMVSLVGFKGQLFFRFNFLLS